MNRKIVNTLGLLLATLAASLCPLPAQEAGASGPNQNLPKPDGKPADLTKPVQVFIMMGQSNMVGLGRVSGPKGETLEKAVKEEKLYPFLTDAAGNWSERKDVRFTQVMVGKKGGMDLRNNTWLKVGGANGKIGTLGPEFGIGHHLGNALTGPVLLLKSCIGNRSLGWDLLPPGSKGFDYTEKDKKTGETITYTYAGYKESPMRWEKGTEPVKGEWYAGIQYDNDVANAKAVLADLQKYYPGAKGYEVAGFFWWQGEKDCGDAALSNRYEQNMVHFINTIRNEFKAPKAKFVIGTLGEATKGMSGNTGKVLEAHLAVDGKSGKYPEFKGNVATVYTHPMARGGSGNGHYDKNAKVYMDVGLAMGEAMNELLKTK
jgi:hypothetical protein